MEHDHTKSLEIAANMRDAVNAMNRMSSDAGVSVQVERLSSRRFDKLLGKYVLLTAALDSRGRAVPMELRKYQAMAMPEYEAEFDQLATQLKDACVIGKQWDVQDRRYEAARSLLSFSKTIKWETDGP